MVYHWLCLMKVFESFSNQSEKDMFEKVLFYTDRKNEKTGSHMTFFDHHPRSNTFTP